MAYLDAVETRFDYDPEADFPFNLALFSARVVARFDTPVTFFVGDNGAGKSTLLEAIAASFRLPALTQTSLSQHPLMQPAAALAKKLTLIRRTPKKHGFFFVPTTWWDSYRACGVTRRNIVSWKHTTTRR